ncbi:MAG: N-acetylmuramoyl-L-alanine amidase, partial [Geminicoccaceae bacterium]|nr:N-acetylmuramoyl-L-alanine amidase [Geminicoccaceae bacterium]
AARPRPAEPPAAPAEPSLRPAVAPPASAPVPSNGLVQPAGRIVVAVDPGHGGSDPGTIGVDGVKEKDLVLAMGLELARALEGTGRYTAVLTRRSDEGLALRERIKIAREAGAQLFLSLHADSIADPTVSGASVYTLSETASDEEAAALAAKENKADILTGVDLSRHDPIVAGILIDLAQRDTLNKSIDFSQILAEELAKVTPLLRNHRRFAGFAVLKSPETPSVLIELGYLSNPEEAKRLGDPRHRRKLAQAIVAAIDRHTGAVK